MGQVCADQKAAGKVWAPEPSRYRWAAILGAACLLLLSGCANVTLTPNAAKPPTSGPPKAGQSGAVTITPQYVALAPGQKFQFQANGGGARLTWTVNAAAGSSGSPGSVDSSGNYTAPASVSQSEN